jgi:hypothetical protein
MEIERVRVGAKQLSQTAEQLQGGCSRLLTQVRGINWQGPSREDFIRQYEQMIRNIIAAAEEGIVLGQRVQREIDEWQEADQTGSSEWSALAVLPAMTFSKFLGNTWSNFKGVFDPADLNEGINYMLSTDAGKELIKEAEEKNLGFRLPDGRIIGAKDGKIIPIRFGDSGEGTRGVYRLDPDGNAQTEDQEIVISNDWLTRRMELSGRDGLGNTLAHEMQHAVDDQKGLLSTPPFEGSLDDEAAVEKQLGGELQQQVATEVRAWERGSAVEIDRAYRDDGAVSRQEAQDILNKGYEERYEKALNDSAIGKKYTADVYLDESGKVQVDLKPKPALTPISI